MLIIIVILRQRRDHRHHLESPGRRGWGMVAIQPGSDERSEPKRRRILQTETMQLRDS